MSQDPSDQNKKKRKGIKLRGESIEPRILMSATPLDVTWDGDGPTDDSSSAVNWVGDTAPTSADTLIFDDTSTENVEIDVGFSSTIGGMQFDSDYTGTVSLSQDLVIDGDLTINGGEFDSAVSMKYVTHLFLFSRATMKCRVP